MNPDRRPLQFASFAAILPDVEQLQAGHRTVGHWTLGQICEHLATVTRLLVDLPADIQHDPAHRVSDEMKQQIFTTGQIPENLPMPGRLTTPALISPAEGADQLRAALAHYQASTTGPVAPHRLFGHLTRAEWDRLVCAHCAHHLSFAHPEAA